MMQDPAFNHVDFKSLVAGGTFTLRCALACVQVLPIQYVNYVYTLCMYSL